VVLEQPILPDNLLFHAARHFSKISAVILYILLATGRTPGCSNGTVDISYHQLLEADRKRIFIFRPKNKKYRKSNFIFEPKNKRK